MLKRMHYLQGCVEILFLYYTWNVRGDRRTPYNTCYEGTNSESLAHSKLNYSAALAIALIIFINTDLSLNAAYYPPCSYSSWLYKLQCQLSMIVTPTSQSISLAATVWEF